VTDIIERTEASPRGVSLGPRRRLLRGTVATPFEFRLALDMRELAREAGVLMLMTAAAAAELMTLPPGDMACISATPRATSLGV